MVKFLVNLRWHVSLALIEGFNSKSTNSSSKLSSFSAPLTPRSEDDILRSPNIKSFSFSELKNATRNFRPDSVLGEGGFGSVFKGWVDEQSLTATKSGTGIVIAVKRLNQEGFQGHKEWLVSINLGLQCVHCDFMMLAFYNLILFYMVKLINSTCFCCSIYRRK